jgi:hypothetical protein
MSEINDFKDLKIWQKGIDIAEKCYFLTKPLRGGNREEGTGNSARISPEDLGYRATKFIYERNKNIFSRRIAQEKIRPCTNPLILIMGISLFPVPS